MRALARSLTLSARAPARPSSGRARRHDRTRRSLTETAPALENDREPALPHGHRDFPGRGEAVAAAAASRHARASTESRFVTSV